MNRCLLLWIVVLIPSGCNKPPSTKERPIPQDISEELKHTLKQLNSISAKERGNALLRLCDMGQEDRLVAVPWALDLLADNRVSYYILGSRVAQKAATFLRGTNHEKVFKEVIKASKSDNPTVREHAVWSFPRDFMANKRAIPHVLKLTKDKNPEVREAAAKRLASISGKYYGDNPKAWQQWWEEYSGQRKEKSEKPEDQKSKEDINADDRQNPNLELLDIENLSQGLGRRWLCSLPRTYLSSKHRRTLIWLINRKRYEKRLNEQ